MSSSTIVTTTTTTTTSRNSHYSIHDHDHDDETQVKPFDLDRITVPHYGSHIQAGRGISTDGNILAFQDGSTILEFRSLPNFEIKRIHWRHGLIRDIIYSPHFDRFILLTRDAVYSISGRPMQEYTRVRNKPLIDFPVSKFEGVQPFDDRHLFWQCTSVGRSLYIICQGRGTVVEEYTLSSSATCKIVNRWQPPKTCKPHECIWAIRHHPDSDQLGLTVVDSGTKQWRFEVRNREKFSILWSVALPFTRGDAEISIVPNEQWLIINTFGLQMIQLSKSGMKAAIDYDSELRGAVVLEGSFFVIRAKSTLDIHRLDLLNQN